jgi:hypothetical protein
VNFPSARVEHILLHRGEITVVVSPFIFPLLLTCDEWALRGGKVPACAYVFLVIGK